MSTGSGWARADAAEEPVAHHSLTVSYALFVVTALLIIACFLAPFFRVTSIEVRGKGLATSQIRQVAAIKGDDIMTVRASSLLAKIRQRDPAIVVHGVSVTLPNTVVVDATMARPVAAWRQAGKYYLLDKYGRLTAQIPAKPHRPIIENDTVHTWQVGQYVPAAVVLDARYAKWKLKAIGVYGFALGTHRGLMIHSGQGWTAILGLPTGRTLVRRIFALRALIPEAQGKLNAVGDSVQCVDLRPQTPDYSDTPCSAFDSAKWVPAPAPNSGGQ
jgi:hypothetical protein